MEGAWFLLLGSSSIVFLGPVDPLGLPLFLRSWTCRRPSSSSSSSSAFTSASSFPSGAAEAAAGLSPPIPVLPRPLPLPRRCHPPRPSVTKPNWEGELEPAGGCSSAFPSSSFGAPDGSAAADFAFALHSSLSMRMTTFPLLFFDPLGLPRLFLGTPSAETTVRVRSEPPPLPLPPPLLLLPLPLKALGDEEDSGVASAAPCRTSFSRTPSMAAFCCSSARISSSIDRISLASCCSPPLSTSREEAVSSSPGASSSSSFSSLMTWESFLALLLLGWSQSPLGEGLPVPPPPPPSDLTCAGPSKLFLAGPLFSERRRKKGGRKSARVKRKRKQESGKDGKGIGKGIQKRKDKERHSSTLLKSFES